MVRGSCSISQEFSSEDTWKLIQNSEAIPKFNGIGKLPSPTFAEGRVVCGTHFDLEMQQDLEPMVLLEEIENVLLLAGWEEQAPRPERPTFNRVNRPSVAVGRTVAGVWVVWPTGSSLKDAADAIRDGLKGNGIVASSMQGTQPDAYDADKVHVWVGVKPIPIENPFTASATTPARRRYPKAPFVED